MLLSVEGRDRVSWVGWGGTGWRGWAERRAEWSGVRHCWGGMGDVRLYGTGETGLGWGVWNRVVGCGMGWWGVEWGGGVWNGVVGYGMGWLGMEWGGGVWNGVVG